MIAHLSMEWSGSRIVVFKIIHLNQAENGLTLYFIVFPQRGWAAPRGSAILGQPVGPAKQASLRVPGFKN